MVWYPDIATLAKPIYRGLADRLEADIAAGRLRDGDRLPPQRDLAAALGVTLTTVTRAIREATRRGIVAGRAGSGTFVLAASVREPAPVPAGPDVVDLSLNTVPVAGVAPILDRILREVAGGDPSAQLFDHQVAQGSAAHREVAARWLAERQLDRDPSAILLTHGAQHGLMTCLSMLTRPGERVLCEAFAFTGIRRLAQHLGVRLVGVEMDEGGIRPDDLRRKLAETQASVLICSAAVQNPTAATLSLERRHAVVAACRHHGASIIEDDINGHLAGDPEPPLAAIDGERVFYVTSLAKCVAPGLRFGVLCPPAPFLGRAQDGLVAMHWTAPSFHGEIFSRLVEGGGMADCYAVHRGEMAARRRLAADVLGSLVPDRDGLPSFHLWVEVPAAWSSADFVAALAQAGVKVSPGSHFAVDAGGGEGAGGDARGGIGAGRIRICMGGVTENVLSAGLAEIARLMRQLPLRNVPLV